MSLITRIKRAFLAFIHPENYNPEPNHPPQPTVLTVLVELIDNQNEYNNRILDYFIDKERAAIDSLTQKPDPIVNADGYALTPFEQDELWMKGYQERMMQHAAPQSPIRTVDTNNLDALNQQYMEESEPLQTNDEP